MNSLLRSIFLLQILSLLYAGKPRKQQQRQQQQQRTCPPQGPRVYRYVGPCEEIPDGDEQFDPNNVPAVCRIGLIGETGEQGDPGRSGFPGANGMVGVQGPRGQPGAEGPPGNKGPQGSVGDRGPTGPPGPTGPQGDTGLTGTEGAQGPVGEQGPTGPTGPQGPESTPLPGQVKEYMNVYNTRSFEVNNTQAIPFDTNWIATDAFFHIPAGNAPLIDPIVKDSTVFVVLKTGTYKITFLVLTKGNSGAVALVVNNDLLPENTYTIKSSNQQIQGFLIEVFNVGDKFGFFHVNDSNAFDLGEPINASVIIEKLG